MTDLERAAGATGAVTIGDIQVTITPLTIAEERSLRRQLLKAATEAAGDYFTRCAKLLAAMKAQPVAYMKAVEVITTLTATGPAVSDEQFAEYRESPAGVALELFMRGKKATPGLDVIGLRAVITEANVDEIIEGVRSIIEGAGPNVSTP